MLERTHYVYLRPHPEIKCDLNFHKKIRCKLVYYSIIDLLREFEKAKPSSNKLNIPVEFSIVGGGPLIPQK